MNTYHEFPDTDGSPISVVQLDANRMLELPHCHEYYEMPLITKGSCRHVFKGVTALAVPGDLIIIPPHQPHNYKYLSEVSITACFFYIPQNSSNWSEILKNITLEQEPLPADPSAPVLHNHWQQAAFYTDTEGTSGPTGNAAEIQGIIHLNTNEYTQIFTLLRSMMDEQQNHKFGNTFMKSAYLQLILVFLSRIQARKRSKLNIYSGRKKKLANDAMLYIEKNLEKITSSTQIAEELFLSPAYFRSLFKDVTGMTPTDYLNRMRIIVSLEYLEQEDLSIAEAAERVGIYDSNYYSRLFKKIMGYSPRYFKKSR